MQISQLHVAYGALPTTHHSYIIYGLNGGIWTEVARATRLVESGKVNITEPISIPSNTYDGIRILVERCDSWINLLEVNIIP